MNATAHLVQDRSRAVVCLFVSPNVFPTKARDFSGGLKWLIELVGARGLELSTR